ncbi:hypothetical protein OBBRIDRAFT_813714 [Obba rivulosa]|uniref:Asl1-like glycosyl hydrolase catalytic domain-containing protein n=1 Tax=Obba rivulosa TaxID=1052685 RepID=A0A8E2AP52_9APHY|nr:hypothetical protein OBBRIDRAFT_813714 [Obba rivulosa]
MAVKLFNLLALTSLAIAACSFGAAPANALNTRHHDIGRRHVAHDGIAKKRSQTQRCKQRPSSSAAPAPSSTKAPAPTSSAIKVVASSSAAPPPPPSSSAAPAPSPSSAPSSGGGKVGVAWANGDSPDLANFKTDKTSLLYTWSAYKPSNADQLGFSFMPMLWGQSQIDQFEQMVTPGYGSIILGFNEPDQSGQSNLDPETAASLWMQHIEPKRSMGYTLGAPAVSSADAGRTWYQNFLNACNGQCTIDHCVIHWYGTDPQQFISYVSGWQSQFNCPDILITEYADENFVNMNDQASASDISTFYSTVNKWMDETDYVKAYFAFGIMTNMQGVNQLDSLMGSDGQPTSLGWQYINDSW